MADHHRRSSSITLIRLSQSLPPLPISLDDIRPRNLPQTSSIPHHDNPSAEVEHAPKSPLSPANLPPSYEPMYDYLRSQQQPIDLLPPRRPPHIIPETGEPYRDDPFVVTIDLEQEIFQPPPPSYDELYTEGRDTRELDSLVRELDLDSTPSGEICMFVVAMLFIALTVACVGTAFHWGKLDCQGPRC